VPGDLIGYHYVRSGRMLAQIDGEPPLVVEQGNILLLPRNDPHLLFSRPGLDPTDVGALVEFLDSGLQRIVVPGDGEPTEMYCGYLGVSASHHPLLDSLPPMLSLDLRDDRKQWVESSLRMVAEEAPSAELVARLAELFFAEAIRAYMDSLPPGQGGWLAGLRDPAVARALAVIHSRYAEDLDVELLAREAGVSRSALGERFVALLGEPPMRYCGRWRMRMAANMLRDGKANTANIAYAVGFNSEAAFNRAFKREHGEPPATWRRRAEAETRARLEAESQPLQMPKQQVHYCTARDGTRLAYSAVGEGPPLIKTANWLNHIEYDWESPLWRHWIRTFSHGHRLIRYDERGNGLSDWDTPELSLDAFVDDLEAVADCLELDQFDLIAISQGAAVSIAFAVRYPERVRRLVICNGYAAGWAARGDPEEIARREAMLTLTRLGWGLDNPAYRQVFTGHYIPGATHAQMDWFNEMQRRSASPENAIKLQRTLGLLDVRDLLERVRTPTLVFHSRGDLAVPFSQGEELARGIPGAGFVPLDSENHILLGTEPAWEQFSQLSREFLKGDLDQPFVAAAVREPEPEPAESRHSCVAADGARIAYAVTGQGFPLVKAPTWMTHLDCDEGSPAYGHWLLAGMRGNRFVRCDMRGFGLSDWNPPNFDFEHMVGDLAAVIDDAGIDACDLLGLSHGGAIAMAYAARYPHRVRKLILVNSFAAGWRVRADPEEIAWRESLMAMNRRQPSFRRSRFGEMFITLYYPSASQRVIDWHNEHFDKLGPTDSIEPMIDLVSRIDIRGELEKIRAPTLVFHGRLDGNAPIAAGREMADGIAGSRFIELDSANHFLLADEPAWPIVAREVRAFLAEERETAAAE
jgi:pimeloyl-ACP methyl ester carboxylesterase/AraC-like DNA-binding protein